jgi:hypothetical protein
MPSLGRFYFPLNGMRRNKIQLFLRLMMFNGGGTRTEMIISVSRPETEFFPMLSG